MAPLSASPTSQCPEPKLVLVHTCLSDSKDLAPKLSQAPRTDADGPAGAPERSTFDLVMPLANPAEGAAVPVLRARPGRVELGEVRPLVHGRPVSGELVQLKQRKDSPHLYDVESSLTLPGKGKEAASSVSDPAPKEAELRTAGRRLRAGPAQVATEAYRSNWERIYGGGSNGSGGLLN